MSGSAYERHACPDCAAFLGRWTHNGAATRWRCPWTRDSDAIPDDGDWTCGRPYARRIGPDQVSVIMAARPNITNTV